MSASLPLPRDLPYAANCSLLFTEYPLLKRAAAARAAGFEAVEFWWPFGAAAPSDRDVDQFVESIEHVGVRLIALNFAAGDMSAGDRGLVSWVGREREFRESVQVAAVIADRLGTRLFNALYGNRLPGIPADRQDDCATENLAYAAAQLSATGGVILLEALSEAPRYPLRTASSIASVLDRVSANTGVANVKMLADLYHLAKNGEDLAATIDTYADRIGHVQIADVPGRHEPGTGQLDLARHLAALAAAGYRGWVALEYIPQAGTDAGLRAMGLPIPGIAP
jgi:hydroxypyruvate isomerase